MKYKLIKTYLNSPSLGTIVDRDFFSPCNLEHENFSEFWEEVIDKNYEVISYMSKGNNILYPKGAVVDAIILVKEYGIDSSLFYVNSVRRLSDGEVFTLGDRVRYKDNGHVGSCNIGKFYLNDHGGCIIHGSEGYRDFSENINLIEKVVEKPLFTTEDGFDVYPNDTYWCVNTAPHLWSIFQQTAKERTKLTKGVLAFKNVNLAQEYVDTNKPKKLFTTTDGVDICEGDSYWYINIDSPNINWKVFKYKQNDRLGSMGARQFSAKEKAEEYIIQNKPCLSLKDVKSKVHMRWSENYKLESIVKDKLNFKED